MKDSTVRSEFVRHCTSTMENGLRDKVLQAAIWVEKLQKGKEIIQAILAVNQWKMSVY